MAQNKTMAIKHAKARKEAGREAAIRTFELNYLDRKAMHIKANKIALWNMKHKPYS